MNVCICMYVCIYALPKIQNVIDFFLSDFFYSHCTKF
jgi:hypothetical protein